VAVLIASIVPTQMNVLIGARSFYLCFDIEEALQ
jgi:hypothetical protein